MREMLFRGKRKDKGEWAYGGIEQSKLVTLIYDIELPYCNQVQVIPETIGQYTGLPDKNGVEIYEGDIVSNGVFRATVEYLNDLAGYYPFASEIKSFYPPESQVIGNIHDNPELMEVWRNTLDTY